MGGTVERESAKTIAQHVRTLYGDPADTHQALLEEALRISGAPAAMFLGVTWDGHDMRYGDHIHVVGDRSCAETFAACGGQIYRPPYDPKDPPRNQVGRWADLGEVCPGPRDQYPIITAHYEPLGLRDQQRMLVYEGEAFVGWMGTLHREPVSRRTRQRMKQLFGAFYDAVQATERAARGDEHFPAGHVLLDGRGRILARAEGCEAWESAPARDALSQIVRRFDRGGSAVGTAGRKRVALLRLDGDGGVRYLAKIDPLRLPRRSPLAALSPRQREIAELAAAGLVAREIADALDVRTSTVQTHLKEIHRRLEVSNRAELCQVVESAS